MPGINGKMSEIQASLGLVNLEILSEERKKRERREREEGVEKDAH